MRLDLFVHFVNEHPSEGLEPILRQMAQSLKDIHMDMTTLAQALTDAGTAVTAVGANLTEALGEISQDITDLQTQIAAGAQTSPAVDAALVDLQTKLTAAAVTAKSLADIVPGSPPAGP